MESSLKLFNTYIRDWFSTNIGKPTAVQRQSWPLIQSGQNVLISAPTGTGKTFSSFLFQINKLLELSLQRKLESKIYAVYVSPLKALSHDIEKNLSKPLSELKKKLEEEGVPFQDIQIAVRTGDTPTSVRQKILKKPPHILVTTPESFYLMLTAKKSREILSDVDKIIIDEIHAIAGDKRGSHLSLSMERLESLVGRPVQRIGLSATLESTDEMQCFLVGQGDEGPRSCATVKVARTTSDDLAIMTPEIPLSAVCSHEQWDELYDQIVEQIKSHRTTLIFVNTRKLAERISHHLKSCFEPELVGCHHGSMSREKRLNVECSLKSGELKVVVATASLELGIDIGSIDLVIQVGSPRFLSTFMQRMGRAGHQVGGRSKVRIVCLTREELVESVALFRAVKSGALDKIIIPEKPADILAQQIVAEVAARESVHVEDIFSMFRRSFPYRNLTAEDMNEVISLLETGLSHQFPAGRYLIHDDVDRVLKPRPGARLAAITSGGAIPELAEYRVVMEDGTFVGTLDEEYAVESTRGDVFLLGNHSWRVIKIEAGRMIVADAHGETPSVPFWQGEAPGRSLELSKSVSDLREWVEERLESGALQKIKDVIAITDDAGEIRGLFFEIFRDLSNDIQEQFYLTASQTYQFLLYMVSQKLAIGVLPTQKRIVFERFFDMTGSMHLIIHAPFGQKINKAWGLAMRKSYCRSFDFELQAAADDNGFGLALGPKDSTNLSSLFKMVNSKNAYSLVEQAILQIPLFQVRWRWNLNRALAVLRFSSGKKVLPHFQRYKADDLLTSCFPDKTMCFEHITGDIEVPNHPYVVQTMRDCMTEAMDFPRLQTLLEKVDRGEIEFIAKDVREPSPFSHELIHANPYSFLDEAPLEERRTRSLKTPHKLDLSTMASLEILDSRVIEQLSRDSQPKPRNIDELYSLIKQSKLIPYEYFSRWPDWTETLVDSGKAIWPEGFEGRLLMLHSLSAFQKDLIGHLSRDSTLKFLDDCVMTLLMWQGPTQLPGLVTSLQLPENLIRRSLANLIAVGEILEGDFTGEGKTEWCSKGLLSKIHRQSLKGHREQVRAISGEKFISFLIQFHQLDHRIKEKTRIFREVVNSLEAYEAPGSVWESELFADRMSGFSRSMLDEWTLSGRLLWFRVPSEKSLQMKSKPKLHGRTPVVFIARENLPKFLEGLKGLDFSPDQLDSDLREVYDYLEKRGAVFLDELLRTVSLTQQKLIPVLSEMIHRGLICIDGFTAFRVLSQRKKLHAPDVMTNLEMAGRISLNPCLKQEKSEDSSGKEAFLEYWCELILDRYGVACRDLLQKEKFSPPWRDLAPIYRRMELQGQIRGGRFIEKCDGSQYSSRDTFRMWSLFAENSDEKWQVISAADPCNVFGVLTEGKKVTALRHTKLLVQDGKILAVYQNGFISYENETCHSQKELFSRALKVSGPIRRIDPFLQQEEKALDTKPFLENRRPQNLRYLFQERV